MTILMPKSSTVLRRGPSFLKEASNEMLILDEQQKIKSVGVGGGAEGCRRYFSYKFFARVQNTLLPRKGAADSKAAPCRRPHYFSIFFL